MRWSEIKGFPNYIISETGIVVNVISGKDISISVHKHGHHVVRLWDNGETKLFNLYRLLAIYFIPNPENKREVNHIDGSRLNYALSNLEWVTPSENMKHAYKNRLLGGTYEKGSKHSLRKLSLQDIYNIRTLRKQGHRLKAIGAKFNITPDHACRVCKHKQTIENE